MLNEKQTPFILLKNVKKSLFLGKKLLPLHLIIMCDVVGGFYMTTNPVAFKGVYKVTMPKVTDAKNEKEKAAFTEVATNVVVMGANASVAMPKVDKATSSIYFKINDKNDANFEAGFKNILDHCNKQLGVDMAKRAYMQKVSEAEYQKAEALK